MSKGSYADAARQLQTLLSVGAIGSWTDADLLSRFAAREGDGSERAFAMLVERHGPMVLRTCRARLGDDHAASDAFQATFLVLASRARSLTVQGSLGPWLHAVAWRVASSARTSEARRKHHERRAAEHMDIAVTASFSDDRETVLHEEIDRLAPRLRLPMVLCGLAGLSTTDAAKQLGWPVGTVRSRFARGRDRLRDRLTRRGLAPSAVVLNLTEMSTDTLKAVPSALAMAASRGASSIATAGMVPAVVASLASTTIWSMTMTKGIRAVAAILAIGASTFATVAVVARTVSPPSKSPRSRSPRNRRRPRRPQSRWRISSRRSWPSTSRSSMRSEPPRSRRRPWSSRMRSIPR